MSNHDKCKSKSCNKSWKSNKVNISIVPTYSRPLNPLVNSDRALLTHVPFKPNPIKHWRKQLFPNPGSGSRKVGIGSVMDTPGGFVNLVNNHDVSGCSNIITNYIVNHHKNNCISDKKKIRRTSISVNECNYISSASYLQSRVKLYDQGKSVIKTEENSSKYNSLYNRSNCSNTGCNNSIVSVSYKPNNPTYSQRGAVSNSLRIQQLKYETTRNTAYNMKPKWGLTGENAIKKTYKIPCKKSDKKGRRIICPIVEEPITPLLEPDPQSRPIFFLINNADPEYTSDVSNIINNVTLILNDILTSSDISYNINIKTFYNNINGIAGLADYNNKNIELNMYYKDSYITLNDIPYNKSTFTLLHEILHIFGAINIDSTNSFYTIINNRHCYTGQNGLNGYHDVLLANDYSINNINYIPLENNFGGGTANSHFEEGITNISGEITYEIPVIINGVIYPIVTNEIMTGFTNQHNYLTYMSLGILEDLGFGVNYLSSYVSNTGNNLKDNIQYNI